MTLSKNKSITSQQIHECLHILQQKQSVMIIVICTVFVLFFTHRFNEMHQQYQSHQNVRVFMCGIGDNSFKLSFSNGWLNLAQGISTHFSPFLVQLSLICPASNFIWPPSFIWTSHPLLHCFFWMMQCSPYNYQTALVAALINFFGLSPPEKNACQSV